MDVKVTGVAMSSDGKQAIYVATDPKATYSLVSPSVDLQEYNPAFTEWVDPYRVDFNLMPPAQLQQHYQKSTVSAKGLPMSFLQVQTVEEGVEWYKANTKYPDMVCEMLAKYEWGDLRYTTKKEFKNMKKKSKKKKQKQEGMKIRRSTEGKPIFLPFD